MGNTTKHFITMNNKKYTYTLKPHGKDATFVRCEGANIAQGFLNEDIPALLNDLPKLILAEKDYKQDQTELIRFRITPTAKKKIERKALQRGYPSVSSYLRDVALEKTEMYQ